MDNIFEILVPLVIAGIYFFGNMLSKKSDDDAAPKGAPRRGSEDADADAIGRQRGIQEDIRRKIMERRLGEQGSSRPGHVEGRASASSADQALRERREAVEQRRQQRQEEKQSTRGRHKADRQLQGHPTSHIPHPKSRSSAHPESAFSWDESDNAYEQEMQAKLQQIEATRQKAEKLKKQATTTKRSERQTSTSRQPALSLSNGPALGLSRGSVRSTLSDPAAARAAFIYGEVLGQPVSQKKHQTVPGLS